MTILNHTPLKELMPQTIPVPEWWTSREQQVQLVLHTRIETGTVSQLAASPGGREVGLITYNDPQPEFSGTANFNSAVAARDGNFYCDRAERPQPVLMITAGCHGAEAEGVVGTLSLLSVMETGRDLLGNDRPELKKLMDQLRLVIIPLCNPDGRVRVPYDGWVGLPAHEMHKVNQGTHIDGTLYGWPGCKAIHPMEDDVGFLGGYFDDAGINLMHDEWSAPMSPVTRGIMQTIRSEAPDMRLDLHSYESAPGILSMAYVPMTVKQRVADLAEVFYRELDAKGIAHNTVPAVTPDGEPGNPEPVFNQTSASYHAGAALPMTVEFPHGLGDVPQTFSYEEIHESVLTLFAAAAEYLLQ